MLYTRGELVQLCRDIAPELDSLLIALIWFASRCDPNLVSTERYGLLQVDINQARASGFSGQPNELLDPKVNIQVAANLIRSRGLIEFCGRALASQLPSILKLESFLKTTDVEKIEANQKLIEQ